jgi:hypothetical protein
MGGIYNIINSHLYHYAGNNPVKYLDPDGRSAGDIISGLFAAFGTLMPLINGTAGIDDLNDINALITGSIISLNKLASPLGTVTIVAMIVAVVILYCLKDPILELYDMGKRIYEKYTRINIPLKKI